MKYLFILIGSFFSIGNFCYSQFNYQLSIKDISKSPIPFATIAWDASQGTITDESGFASLYLNKAIKPDSISISCIGFESKSIAVSSLATSNINNIYLPPLLLSIDEITVKTKKKKAIGPTRVVKRAISSIKKNYPLDTISLQGYYREYSKLYGEHINVFESIVNIYDPGFGKNDNFEAELLFKRFNHQYKQDSVLLLPYDNTNKYVPFSTMPANISNELLLLRAHDPVRNYKQFSFDFVGKLKRNLIGNHTLSKPKLTYLNNIPYYYIEIASKKKHELGRGRFIHAKGYIYIDAQSYAFKKINYQTYVESDLQNQKLYELTLEYKKHNNKYFPNYISFNNLYKTKDCYITKSEFDKTNNCISLHFSKRLANKEASLPSNYKVKCSFETIPVKSIEINDSQATLKLDSTISLNGKQMNVDVLWLQKEQSKSNISKDHSYYQYREFFVKEIMPKSSIGKGSMNKALPVSENPIVTSVHKVDTNWFSSPLVVESTFENKITEENRIIMESIEPMYKLSEKKQNDLVYMHTDREVYAPGDTIWLKAYIRNKSNLQFSNKSNSLFTKLIDKNGEVDDGSKFVVVNGTTKGQIVIGKDLKEGTYTLVAYSSWMKNFDAEEVFKKRILVKYDKQENYYFRPTFNKKSYLPGDTLKILVNCVDNYDRIMYHFDFKYQIKSEEIKMLKGKGNTAENINKEIEFVIPHTIANPLTLNLSGMLNGKLLESTINIPVKYGLHVSFFPEGGHCINNQTGYVAFKAVTSDGKSINIKGNIINGNNKVLKNVSSAHDGMGKFLFKPVKGKKYYLKITEPVALQDTFLLPIGIEKGLSMKAESINNTLSVLLKNTNKVPNMAFLTLRIREQIYYHKLLYIQKQQLVKLNTEELPTGIGVLTLFDDQMNPRCERLLYINHDKESTVSLKTGLKAYMPRDSVTLKIKVSDNNGEAIKGNYSLSVIDQQLSTSPLVSEPNIKSTLLLSSEIKGKIHNPDYYFSGHPQAKEHLDYLLLCQGWRCYKYMEQLENVDSMPTPTNQDAVKGQVVKNTLVKGKIPFKSTVVVFHGKRATNVKTDSLGKFSFIPLYSQNSSGGLLLEARSKSGSDKLEIILDSCEYDQKISLFFNKNTNKINYYSEIPILTQQKLKQSLALGLQNHQWIEEVDVKAFKPEEDALFNMDELAINRKIASREDLTYSGDLMGVLSNMGLNVTMEQRETIYGVIDVLLNHFQGRYEDVHWNVNGLFSIPSYSYNEVEHIPLDNIDKLSIVRGLEANSLYDMDYNVVVVIKHSVKLNKSKLMNRLKLERSNVSKEFYKLIYNTEEKRQLRVPDKRKTIHWEPNVKLDENGEATVTFYNADRYGNIKCELQGVSESGIPVSQTCEYQVQFEREE